MQIKNVVFDIGNVLVKWAPQEIIKTCFKKTILEELELTERIFRSSLWADLNLGKFTETKFLELLAQEPELDHTTAVHIMNILRESLVPLIGSFELVQDLHKQGVALYSLTDNVREIISYLKARYPIFDFFRGIVVSADVGALKPAPKIYQHLLKSYDLVAEETLFFDDLLGNIEGAQRMGMQAVQFTTALKAREKLIEFGILG